VRTPRYRGLRLNYFYRDVRFEARARSSWWYKAEREAAKLEDRPHRYVGYWWFAGVDYEELSDIKTAIDASLVA
jgi:hypothetical protein